MRTFCLSPKRWVSAAALLLAVAGAAVVAGAQVLARPGWAGSGVTVEPWWRRGVFYRIEPQRFQDSDGDGVGDLAGVAQRMSYVQSLGVDALVLRLGAAEPGAAAGPAAAAGLDDLLRAATGARVRVLVELQPQADADAAATLAAGRAWLTQGAAGLWVDSSELARALGDEEAAKLLKDLRALAAGFPGDRIVVATEPEAAGDHAALRAAVEKSAQLVASAVTARTAEAAPLRLQVAGALGLAAAAGQPAEAVLKGGKRAAAAAAAENPLLVEGWPELPADAVPEQRSALDAGLGAVLLGSRGAVLIEAGQEIGLGPAADGKPARMQWTPKNVTVEAVRGSVAGQPGSESPDPGHPVAVDSVEDAEEHGAVVDPTSQNRDVGHPAPADPNVYGAFKPYVAPKPKPAPPKPVDPTAVLPAPAPDTLPGFTTGALTADGTEVGDAKAVNVAVEDADARSLLNFYRRLIQLHHGNPSLRNGTEYVLAHDDLNALVVLRRAPAGTTTSATVLVAVNLSARPLVLSLADDLKRLQMRPGAFRTLLTTAAGSIPPQSDTHIALPPYAVFLGELYH